MNVISFDIPIIIVSLIYLIWLRLKGPSHKFHVACQFVATFWAQYSFIVSWSISKFVPLIASTDLNNTKEMKYFSYFTLFVIYVCLTSLISSIFWPIPENISYFYGQGRVFLQILLFGSLVFAARGFAGAMNNAEGPILFWKAVVCLGIVHGLASLYQFLAAYLGLPLIGISRAHGLTFDGVSGDVAMFVVEGGASILRPGGLAGEPKTAAVIFGVVILTILGVGRPPAANRLWANLARASVMLSVAGFVLASSTSGVLALVCAFFALIAFRVFDTRKALSILLLVVFTILVTDYILHYLRLPTFSGLFDLRVTDRVLRSDPDPPVEAAIKIMQSNFPMFLVGAGIGGSTFYIQDLLNTNFEYALTPNIGAIALLSEQGLIGTIALLLPFIILLFKSKMNATRFNERKWDIQFLNAIAISVMIFMLAGSGIALGFPLAIGSVIAAANISATKPMRVLRWPT